MLRPAIRSALHPALRGIFRRQGPTVLAPTDVTAEYVAVFAPQNVQAVEV